MSTSGAVKPQTPFLAITMTGNRVIQAINGLAKLRGAMLDLDRRQISFVISEF